MLEAVETVRLVVRRAGQLGDRTARSVPATCAAPSRSTMSSGRLQHVRRDAQQPARTLRAASSEAPPEITSDRLAKVPQP